MSDTVYLFNSIHQKTDSSYIFQYVRNRKLTDVYHAHDFYEIIYLVHGQATQLVNGGEKLFEPNSILLMRPLDRHCFLNQSENAVVVSLSVQNDEFERLCNAYDSTLSLNIAQGEEPKVYSTSRLLTYTDADFERLTACEREHEFKFLLFCFLKSYLDGMEQADSLPETLVYAISEMKKPETLRSGIRAFSEISNYSQSHLSRLVKRYFGMTLKQYINELRLQRAYNWIVLTQKPVEEISEELGFSSHSHFCKIFKARFHMTPGALRREKALWTA